MKGEAEKKTTAASDAVKENQAQVVESSAAAAASVTAAAAAAAANSALPARQPFTQLSQLESDMAIARALQEQERAYMLLRSGGAYDGGNNPGDEDSEENEDVQGEISTVIDGSHYGNDEEFARALQEAEYRETTARMMALAGIQDVGEDDDDEENDDEQDNDGEEEENEEEDDDDEDDDDEQEQDEDDEDGSDDESQEMWQDVDPDNMSYEELIALGEVVGTESKGLASNIIDELPLSSHKRDLTGSSSSSDCEQCVICRHDYEEEEELLTLPCKHKYHSDCIRQWLQINKVCPVCSADVS